jgi:hypothetical protein
MKTAKIIQSAGILTIALVSQTALAAVCNGLRPKINSFSEMRLVFASEMSRPEQGGFQKVSLTEMPDGGSKNEFHTVDANEATLKPFNTDGIITVGKFNGKRIGHGSATLISPCHVLTNRHVVKFLTYNAKGLTSEQDQRVDRPDLFAKNAPVNFSYGQPKECKPGQQFLEQNLSGKTLEVGSSTQVHDDWAIVKLDRPVSSDTQIPDFNTSGAIGINTRIVMSGFPGNLMDDEMGFNSVRVRQGKVYSMSPYGVSKIYDTQLNRGNSGGTVRGYKDNRGAVIPTVYGINVGSGYILEMPQILKSMSSETYADIERARSTRSCN